jgi:enoyl-CoA hydratase
MTTTVHLERRDRIAVLTLDGPDRLNAIGQSTLSELVASLDAVRPDDEVGAVVVAGAGKAFSAGADLGEIGGLDGPDAFAAHIRSFTSAYAVLESCPKPTIAAIDGVALGGGLELALACDLRIGSSTARLGLPEIKLGLLPGAGGTQRITRLLPVGVAKHLLLTGEPLDAADAHRLGLLNDVVEAGAALAAAEAIACRLSQLPPLALAAAKELVAAGTELSLDAAIVLERETVSRLFGTADRIEGIAAFQEKRRPTFTGR